MNKKTLIATAMGTGMMFAAALPALAAETCINESTGAKSSNTCTWKYKKNAYVDLNNSARVKNIAYVDGNTGDNTQKHNTVGGGITTSNAGAGVHQMTDANSNGVGVDQTGGAPAGGGANVLTGYRSSNNISIITKKTAAVAISNDASVYNKADVDVNTGGNKVKGNTVGGDIHTGEAHAEVMQHTTVNVNVVEIAQ